ncbi:MAG: PAS domain-containing sensor histidine kinase [Anaerolineales bacterium]
MNHQPDRPLPEEKKGVYAGIFDSASDGLIVSDLENGAVVEANPAASALHGYPRDEFIGLLPEDLIHPDSLHQFKDNLEARRYGHLADSPLKHLRRDGSTFYAEWHGAAFDYQGRPCLLSIVRDVSRRVESESSLQQREGVRANENSILLEISQTLASTLELQPALILDQLGLLIRYSHAGLFMLEDTDLVAVAVVGLERFEGSGPLHLRNNGQATMDALFEGRFPIRIPDIWGPEPSAETLRKLFGDDPTGMLNGMHSWMWVPLAVKNRVLGGLGLAHPDPDYFSPHLAGLAMTIANQAAVTMVNAELYEHAQSLAALQERQRLARNLHDAVNQSLFSAGLIAEVLPRLWEQDQDEARQALKDLRRLTRGAQAEMRGLLAELRPSTLTDTELGDLLRLLGNAFAGRTNTPVSVTINGRGEVPTEAHVALYRICQEALNNIAKHARATQVEIDVEHAPDRLVLQVHDNGRGFVTSGLTASGHYGLSMMRERAAAAGASLTIASEEGQGTLITVRWGEQEDS